MRLPRVFYSWYIVAAGTLIALLDGGFHVYGFSASYVPLLDSVAPSLVALGGVIGSSRFERRLITNRFALMDPGTLQRHFARRKE